MSLVGLNNQSRAPFIFSPSPSGVVFSVTTLITSVNMVPVAYTVGALPFYTSIGPRIRLPKWVVVFLWVPSFNFFLTKDCLEVAVVLLLRDATISGSFRVSLAHISDPIMVPRTKASTKIPIPIHQFTSFWVILSPFLCKPLGVSCLAGGPWQS